MCVYVYMCVFVTLLLQIWSFKTLNLQNTLSDIEIACIAIYL